MRERNGKGTAHLTNILASMVAAAVLVLCGAVWAYYVRFGPADFSKDPSVWGQFGDFVGGVVNPVLGFMTLVALVLTIVLQNRQLDVAFQETELSRNSVEASNVQMRETAELQRRTFEAQLAQAAAMEIGARVTAISQLNKHQDDLIDRLQTYGGLNGSPGLTDAQVVRSDLLQDLAAAYASLRGINAGAAQQAVQRDGPASGGFAR